MTDEALLLCCLLWAREGQEAGLEAYEDRVLSCLPDSGGEVLQRVASDGAEGRPHEVQLYRFPSRQALDAYLRDPRRVALAEERELVIARTELFPVSPR